MAHALRVARSSGVVLFSYIVGKPAGAVVRPVSGSSDTGKTYGRARPREADGDQRRYDDANSTKATGRSPRPTTTTAKTV